jgi:hypothetical protein
MKKSLLTVLMVLSMLAMFVGPVAAAPLSAGTATLVSVIYVPGKGPVFTFEVSGEFSNAELNGALQVVGGASYKLYCTQIDKTTVKCTVSKKAAGQNVTLTWGGFQFSTFVPAAREKTQFCYDVYDWSLDASYTWVNYGSYCQENPANYGDVIEWYNPAYDFTYPYEFLPESPTELGCILSPTSGDAYYYPFCPTPI